MEIPKEVGIGWVGSKLRGAFSMTAIAGHVRTKEERERAGEGKKLDIDRCCKKQRHSLLGGSQFAVFYFFEFRR